MPFVCGHKGTSKKQVSAEVIEHIEAEIAMEKRNLKKAEQDKLEQNKAICDNVIIILTMIVIVVADVWYTVLASKYGGFYKLQIDTTNYIPKPIHVWQLKQVEIQDSITGFLLGSMCYNPYNPYNLFNLVRGFCWMSSFLSPIPNPHNCVAISILTLAYAIICMVDSIHTCPTIFAVIFSCAYSWNRWSVSKVVFTLIAQLVFCMNIFVQDHIFVRYCFLYFSLWRMLQIRAVFYKIQDWYQCLLDFVQYVRNKLYKIVSHVSVFFVSVWTGVCGGIGKRTSIVLPGATTSKNNDQTRQSAKIRTPRRSRI